MRKSFLILLILCLSSLPVWAQETPWHSDVDSWIYWLQDISIERLVECETDLAVIDYSSDGSDETAFTRSEIESVTSAGILPIAYLSIGEVEEYRFYWKDNWKEGKPGFIGLENPEWKGNFKSKYWQDAYWKAVLRPYLNKIIAAGFQGVYLDIIDAYYYWYQEGYSLSFTSRKMIRLVERIADYCRREAGEDFLIIPQNGVSIIDDAPDDFRKIYLDVISAIGVEDLFFHVYTKEDQQYRLSLLKEIAGAGLPVFSIEYIASRQMEDYLKFIKESGLALIPYRARPNRELDEILCTEY